MTGLTKILACLRNTENKANLPLPRDVKKLKGIRLRPCPRFKLIKTYLPVDPAGADSPQIPRSPWNPLLANHRYTPVDLDYL